MQGISILILVLLEVLFIWVTMEQKENKGSLVMGMLVSIAILLPIMYILNN